MIQEFRHRFWLTRKPMEPFPSHEKLSKVLIFHYVEKYDRIWHSITFVPEISLVTIWDEANGSVSLHEHLGFQLEVVHVIPRALGRYISNFMQYAFSSIFSSISADNPGGPETGISAYHSQDDSWPAISTAVTLGVIASIKLRRYTIVAWASIPRRDWSLASRSKVPEFSLLNLIFKVCVGVSNPIDTTPDEAMPSRCNPSYEEFSHLIATISLYTLSAMITRSQCDSIQIPRESSHETF